MIVNEKRLVQILSVQAVVFTVQQLLLRKLFRLMFQLRLLLFRQEHIQT